MKTTNNEQFFATFKQTLAPIYLIAGDEPLQQQEAVERIFSIAEKKGFEQRQSFTWQANGFDWQVLYDQTDNLSLFAEKKIIHLRLKKVNKEAQAFIKHYLNTEAMILIISCDKLDANAKKSKWLASIGQQGSILEVYPVRATDFRQWLQGRLKQSDLIVDQESLEYLAACTEGNMLAAKQTIDKLSLLFANTKLSITEMRQVINDHARFDVFDLADAIISAEQTRALHILQHLQMEAVEPTLILWALCREIRLLLSFIETGGGAVWPSKKNYYQKRCRDFSLDQLHYLLQRAHHIDMTIKGIKQANSWDQLASLSVALCQEKSARAKS